MPGMTDPFVHLSKWSDVLPLLLSGDTAQQQAALDLLAHRDRELEDHLRSVERWGSSVGASTNGAGDIVVSPLTPPFETSLDQVVVTVVGTVPIVATVRSLTATGFTVRFFDMAGAALATTAIDFYWHARGR